VVISIFVVGLKSTLLARQLQQERTQIVCLFVCLFGFRRPIQSLD